MEDYQQIIDRIGAQLEVIAIGLDKPLSLVANNYRIVAEAICKAVLIGYGTTPSGKLEQLISSTLKVMEGKEQARDIGVFKAQLKYLQNVGNAYSHDGESTHYSSEVDPRVRQFALEFRSFRRWNHGGMRVLGPDFGKVV